MLVLRFGRKGEALARFTTTLDEISIGSDPVADLVLEDSRIAPRHARLVRAGDAWFVHAHDKGGARLDGQPVTRPAALAPGGTLVLGPFMVSRERDDTSDEELRLLATLAGADETRRAVYADWLEQHGHADRAEFLRAQVAVSRLTPADRAFHAATARVRELARTIDVAWRMRVARPAVEGCALGPETTCGVDWAELAATGDPKLRTCARCRESVQYCTTELEAIALARASRCIVVDFASFRSPMSIETLARGRAGTPQMAMPTTHLERAAPPTLCPQCGQPGDPCPRCDARPG